MIHAGRAVTCAHRPCIQWSSPDGIPGDGGTKPSARVRPQRHKYGIVRSSGICHGCLPVLTMRKRDHRPVECTRLSERCTCVELQFWSVTAGLGSPAGTALAR